MLISHPRIIDVERKPMKCPVCGGSCRYHIRYRGYDRSGVSAQVSSTGHDGW